MSCSFIRNTLPLLWSFALCACVFPLTGASADVRYNEHFPGHFKRMKVADYFETKPQRQLAIAVERGNRKAIDKAVANGADVNHVGRNGMTPIYWAMGKQNFDGLQALIDHGADPNLRTNMPHDWRPPWETAMAFAVRLEDIRYLKALLDAGGDPDTLVDDSNQSLLIIAVLHRRTDNIRLLIERGANVNHQAKFGDTAFRNALGEMKFDIALMLLNLGADPALKNTLETIKHRHRLHKDYPHPSYAELIEALKTHGHLPSDFE